ncbi:MAG: DHH family phosphoesterase [Betaproteobacteria bacterium]|nr:DHH family phosphoesterase [Betaproteobacteria bacterium]
MRRFDVFNGDADGICALHQLRLAQPIASELVTGIKRDTELLQRVDAGQGDEVTVLDISIDRNREALTRLLERGARVRWFDHHHGGKVPAHIGLIATIDVSHLVCTSILVDRHLAGRFRRWAIVAAFGDNLPGPARALAATLHLGDAAVATLRELGTDLNYGACGETEADVLQPPLETYRLVSRHRDPLGLRDEPFMARLAQSRLSDLANLEGIAPCQTDPFADAWLLPDEPWSRRVMSTFANRLANADPSRAHAVLVPNARGGYAVSVRTPAGGQDAARFCQRFPTGGGRARAAGLQDLPGDRLAEFLDALAVAWRR